MVLYLLIVILALYGAKFNLNNAKQVFSIQKNVNSLRGIMSILIVFTHCSLAYTDLPIALLPLRKISTFAVGYFFVLSGYGLAFSYHNKKEYMQSFIMNKIIKKIIFPAFVCMIISRMLIMIYIDEKLSLISIKGAIKSINWYIFALVYLYLIFFVIYSYIDSSEIRLCLIWLVVIGSTFIILALSNFGCEIGRSYYISEWSFPLGITIYEKRKYIDGMIRKSNFMIMALLLSVILGVSFLVAVRAQEGTAVDLISHNIMIFPFYLIIFEVCKYVIFNNKIITFLNKISFEIYLYQFPFLAIIRKYHKALDVMYFIYTAIVTIAFATMMNILMNKSVVRKVK